MAKVYSIKTGKEISEPIDVTARQLSDKLWDIQEELEKRCLFNEAEAVRSARVKLMPRVVQERRAARRAKRQPA